MLTEKDLIQFNRQIIFPVFGSTPSLIASIQVMEGIKLLAGFGGKDALREWGEHGIHVHKP